MPEVRFKFSLSWSHFSVREPNPCPTLGQVLEIICEKMRSGGVLEELGRAGVAFTGSTYYSPGYHIYFEADTLALGFRYADLIEPAVRASLTGFCGFEVRVNDKTQEQIIARLEAAVMSCARELKETRSLFRNAAIAKVRKDLEQAAALKQ